MHTETVEVPKCFFLIAWNTTSPMSASTFQIIYIYYTRTMPFWHMFISTVYPFDLKRESL